jgi:hypothetical protein
MRQIHSIDEARYERLQYSTLAWVRANTTVVRARELLNALHL